MRYLLPSPYLRNSLEHNGGHRTTHSSLPHYPQDATAVATKDPDQLCAWLGCLQCQYRVLLDHATCIVNHESDLIQILTAVLNRYYNFAHPDSTQYLIWYVGEVGTAVYVVNVPACWPLLRKMLPKWLGTSRNASAGATDHSSFRLRSAFQRPASHHNPPAMLSESEENLAVHNVYLHGVDEGRMGDNDFDQSHYRAKATGDGNGRRSPTGIVKTVEFEVSKAM